MNLPGYIHAMLIDNFYIIAGLTDSNADSTNPFDIFFDEQEYFTTLELGRVTSRDRFYLDNMHVTLWHADERETASISEGWGATFSLAHSSEDKWMPFLRGGYANDGGSLLQKSLRTGLGYHLNDGRSLVGLGFNWGQPNEDTFGESLRDQYATELFCRLNVLQNLEITPDVQWIINPALNPDADQSWIFGVRARMFF